MDQISFEGTWIGKVADLIIHNVPVVVALGTVGLIIALGLYVLKYIAKGAGQYGIIEGYVGTIGAGKTTLAVQHAITLAKARNAVLLSNIGIRCSPSCGGDTGSFGVRHEGCSFEHHLLPLTANGLDLESLMETAFAARGAGRGLVLMMDEVGIIMPARLWSKFPVGLMWMLQQSRRVSCEWVWTAQDPTFVDKQLRDLTAVVHYVRSYPPPSIWRRARGKRPWLLIASAFSPGAAPRANGESSSRTWDKRLGRRVVRYKRRYEAAFDTDEIVLPPDGFAGAKELADAVRKGLENAGLEMRIAVSDMGPLAEVRSATERSEEG